MNKKLTIATLCVIIALAVSATIFAFTGNKDDASSNQATSSAPSAQNTSPGDESVPTTDQPITVTGKMTCLTPKNTDGPTTLSCAIGLEGDNGKNYALNANDPTVTGSIPTGQRVEVSGMLAVQDSQYDVAGTIKVDSLQRQ